MLSSRGMLGSLRRLGIAAAAVTLSVGCSGGSPSPSPTPSHGSVVTIPVGVNPAGIAFGSGFAWVANAGEGTVSKVDLKSNRQVARIPVGDPSNLEGCASHNVHQTPHGDFRIRNCDLPKAVAASGRAVWAGKGDTQSLVRIDTGTNRVVATIPIGVEAWYIAATDSAVWVSDWRTQTVVRVDPATNRVVATIADLPNGPTGIAVAPSGVWVACSRDNVLVQIDPATNRVAGTVQTDLTPLPLTYAYGSVWVRNEFREGAGTVQRIDPATGRVVATIPVGPVIGRDGLDGLAVLDGGVWVAGLDLEKIDPATNQVVKHVNHTSNAVSSDAGSLWTVDIAYAVSRITP
jgi:DNA-binding beta-propeller fold protein YncE